MCVMRDIGYIPYELGATTTVEKRENYIIIAEKVEKSFSHLTRRVRMKSSR